MAHGEHVTVFGRPPSDGGLPVSPLLNPARAVARYSLEQAQAEAASAPALSVRIAAATLPVRRGAGRESSSSSCFRLWCQCQTFKSNGPGVRPPTVTGTGSKIMDSWYYYGPGTVRLQRWPILGLANHRLGGKSSLQVPSLRVSQSGESTVAGREDLTVRPCCPLPVTGFTIVTVTA